MIRFNRTTSPHARQVTCEQLIEALNSAEIRKQIPRDIVAEFKKQHTKQIVAATFGKAR